MELTVKDLLDTNFMRNSQLLSGEIGVSNLIKNISIMENPNIQDWIEPQCAIMTNLLPIKDYSSEAQKQFIQQAHCKQVSCLLVKLSIEEIPETIRTGCSTYHIPLIIIPNDVTYNEITYPIMKLLFEHEAYILHYYKNFYESFMNITLTKNQMKNIIQSLSEFLSNPILITDQQLHMIHSFSIPKDFSFKHCHFTELVYIDEDILAFRDVTQEAPILKIVIELFDKQTLNMFIIEKTRKINEIDKIAIKSAIAFIKLDYMKQQAIMKAKQKKQNELIDELFFRQKNQEEIQLIANALHFPIDLPFSVFILTREKASTFTASQLNTLEYLLGSIFSKTILRNYTDSIVCICFIKKKATSDEVKNKLRYVLTNFQRIFQSNVKIHLSSIFVNINEIQLAHKEANKVLELSAMMEQTELISYEDLGIYRLFLKINENMDIEQLLSSKVKELIQHKNMEDLLRTLLVFLDHKQNYSITAKHLYLHSKTVKYRINKIMELLHIDLDKADQVLETHISLKIWYCYIFNSKKK